MRSYINAFFMLCCLLGTFWIAGLLWFITLIPSRPASDTQNTDAIVVLTGGSLRLDHGFELLAQKRASKMFVSGVEDGLTLVSILHQLEYQSIAARIPKDSVTLGYWARTTVGNAEETAQWVEREHIASIRLVTGSYHMPRSIFELRETMPGITIIPEPVFPAHFAHNAWWQFSDSIRLVISEYNKFIASVIVHPLLVKS